MTATEKAPKEKINSGVKPETVMQNLHDRLGVPPDYSHTKAINLFENRWRVNVYCFRKDGIPSLIRRVFIGNNSFYVTVDSEGNILNEIKKTW